MPRLSLSLGTFTAVKAGLIPISLHDKQKQPPSDPSLLRLDGEGKKSSYLLDLVREAPTPESLLSGMSEGSSGSFSELPVLSRSLGVARSLSTSRCICLGEDGHGETESRAESESPSSENFSDHWLTILCIPFTW